VVLQYGSFTRKEIDVATPPHFHWRETVGSTEYEEREERNRIRRKPVEIGREKLINIVVKEHGKFV
jgi:hypothetical protein